MISKPSSKPYRDMIMQTDPDTHGDSAETRRAAVLNEAVEYFRLRFKG
jgi:hypothetical protein